MCRNGFYMKDFIRYAFVITVLLFLFLGCQKQDAVPKHIFFIVVDTLRADHLGCYGYKTPTSPTIDQLANEGTLFTNAFSTASSTLESVASFFTSSTALTNQLYYKALHPNYISLQKSLKQKGYQTLAVISNPWLKTQLYLFKEGFTHYKFVISDSWRQSGIKNTTDLVTETTLDFLQNKFNPSGKNFFYIHYLDPHDAYKPPVDYGFFTGEVPSNPLNVHSLSGDSRVRKRFKKDPSYAGLPRPKPISENNLNYLISRYDGEIRHVDSNIKKLLAKLQEMDILKDSLIIITSDHGEEFLEHGCFKHGFQLYDESIHIPLIFYWKDHLDARSNENLISGIDIAPTILELCQITPPPSMLGKNILIEKKEEPILFCTHFINQKKRGMRTNKWKLIQNVKTNEIKIFDIQNDPEEKNNLFDGNQDNWSHVIKPFEELLEKHVFQKSKKKEEKLEIDPETKEQLKELGYL